MKRLIIGGHEFPVGKIVEVDIPQKHLFVEEMKDGTLRVTYSKALGVTLLDMEAMALCLDER